MCPESMTWAHLCAYITIVRNQITSNQSMMANTAVATESSVGVVVRYCYRMLCKRLSALLQCRPAEVPQGLRAATAPLPQVSSAQEDPELMEPVQGMAEHCGVSPFCAFAQTPGFTPPRKPFQASSLFQSAAHAPGGAPRAGPASHTVHQDRLLPPRGPHTAGHHAALLPVEPSVSDPYPALCTAHYQNLSGHPTRNVTRFLGVSLQCAPLYLLSVMSNHMDLSCFSVQHAAYSVTTEQTCPQSQETGIFWPERSGHYRI